MEYKDKVKFVRQKLMLSQADFAKKLGVAFSTVNEWENGVRHGFPIVMAYLCDRAILLLDFLR